MSTHSIPRPLRHVFNACVVVGGLVGGGVSVGYFLGVQQARSDAMPVPVECHVAEPARPAMPTEHLVPPVDLDPLIAALTAEIELREGYEGELLAALRTCTAPIIER